MTALQASSGERPGAPVDAEALVDAVERLGRDEAADDALAVIGLEAVDPHVLGRQPVPDRQQQAGDDVERALGEFRDAWRIRLPTAARNRSRVAARQCERANSSSVTVSRAIGRIRRVRASMLPSSCIRLAAGTCTAARCDCSLISNRAPVAAGQRRAPRRAAAGGCGPCARRGSSGVSAPVAAWV